MHWWCFISFHSLSISFTLHRVDGGVGISSSSSYTPSSAHVISSHSPSFILASSSCRWSCRKFVFFFLHTIIYMCPLISLVIIHSYSSSCGQWCNSSCLLFTHYPHHNFLIAGPFISMKLSTPNSWCIVLLITTLSFPCSLHMPLITTFSSVQRGWEAFWQKKIFWGNNYVIQALELHWC